MGSPFLIVVSGLPRSGTSMMMAVLQAGGIPLLQDDQRPADQHNARGYFEYQPVLQLAEDNSWLSAGKAVKIVYRLLYHLPPIPTKILFMDRDLGEVVASQQAMLGQPAADFDWPALFGLELKKVRDWLSRQTHIQVLEVSQRDFIDAPRSEARRVIDFLGLPLDLEAMAAAVDRSMVRQRKP